MRAISGEPPTGTGDGQCLVETKAIERAVPSPFNEAIVSCLHPSAVEDSCYWLMLAQPGGPSQAGKFRDKFKFQSHAVEVWCEKGVAPDENTQL
jgi:hypothetical protein